MDAGCLLQKPWIITGHVFLLLILSLASMQQVTGLPQNVPSERKTERERWTIDHCFVKNRGSYDITFVVDSSAKKENFKPVRRFINEITKRLRVVENGAQFGIITFGSRVRKVVRKKRWRHQAELKNAIFSLRSLFERKINLGKPLSLAGLNVNPNGATRVVAHGNACEKRDTIYSQWLLPCGLEGKFGPDDTRGPSFFYEMSHFQAESTELRVNR